MQAELKQVIKDACKQLFGVDIEPEISRPDEQFGDYATNAALQLAGQTGKSPRDVAEQLAGAINADFLAEKPSVAGPGFLNFRLKDAGLIESLNKRPVKSLNKQEIVAEYSDPNPFKILHVGHLYTSVVGDAIANLFESLGARVHRVNFGGDVGLHVAKTMWSILDFLGGENPEELKEVANEKRASWLAERYVAGNAAYEENKTAKPEIIELNKRIYEIQADKDHQSALSQIYWTTRQWSYDYFERFYQRIGTTFEKYYPESETAGPGLKAVQDNVGKIFEESDGAVVFKGEVHNLHTRVFINSQGLPTYEAKDAGLALLKWQDYHFDKSIVITGNEIYEYMQVVLKALEQIEPEIPKRTLHITHGLVKLAGGEKMSSRKGNIIKAEVVLDVTADANKKLNGENNQAVSLGAVKYAFLKNRIGEDFIFDPNESVSLKGNSGPYLQYAHARARSILAKAGAQPEAGDDTLEPAERSLARKISEYSEVVEAAATEVLPSHICTYLYELAQNFNRFYEANRVAGHKREGLRLLLVKSYADVLRDGLGLLNIEAPKEV